MTRTDRGPDGRGGVDAARPVFVLGVGRCGSTLVHEVLARHPDTGFVTNLDDLGVLRSAGWQNRGWRRLPPEVTRKGRVRLAPSEGYRVLAREVSPTLVDPVRDLRADDATPWLATRLRRFVEGRAARLGAPVFLHKLTGWPRAELLDAVFPDARFVHVVRDGRAVANSWLQMPWWRGHRGPDHWHLGPLSPAAAAQWEASGRSFPVLAGLGWNLLMDRFDEVATAVGPDRFLQVRYEDVVADPTATLGSVLEHLQLPWTDGYAAAVQRYRFEVGRTQAFRTDLAPADVAALSAVTAAGLARHGYSSG